MKLLLPEIRSFHIGDISRRYATIFGVSVRIVLISSSVFASHRDRRREPCATSCGLPMASNTWDGSSEPEVQALPEEAHMPFASRSKSRLSPSIPSKQKLTFPGSLFSGSPLRALCGILDRPSISRSLSFTNKRRFQTFSGFLRHFVFRTFSVQQNQFLIKSSEKSYFFKKMPQKHRVRIRPDF